MRYTLAILILTLTAAITMAMPPQTDPVPLPVRVADEVRIPPGAAKYVTTTLPSTDEAGQLWLIVAERGLLVGYGIEVATALIVAVSDDTGRVRVRLEVRNAGRRVVRLRPGVVVGRATIVAARPSPPPGCSDPGGPQCGNE